jgi:hypothetical protein
MDRDKLIRIAVGHLQGRERRLAIDRLLKLPDGLRTQEVGKVLQQRRRRKKARVRASKRPYTGDRRVTWSIRLTPEEYIKFRDRASDLNISMAQHFRHKCT